MKKLPSAQGIKKNRLKAGAEETRQEETWLADKSRVQHIASISKDGIVMIQDVRNSYFPRQHISRNVTAISARGHVAYQRSNVLKVFIDLSPCVCFNN